MPVPYVPPTLAEIKADERAGKSQGVVNQVVIPVVPYHAMPPELAKKFPALEQWNREVHERMSEWRHQANVAFSRLPESTFDPNTFPMKDPNIP